MSLMAGSAFAQTVDPIIMTIGGKNIKRSEFEYAYNKNAAETTIDKKSIDEYVDLFVNYKLKVIAAEEAGIDTTAAFRKEFLMYRDQQIRPTFIVDDDIEREARNIYKQTQTRIDAEGGLVHPLHILVALSQQADAQLQRAASLKADSIYKALMAGADFGDMARRLSDDKASGLRGGDLAWIQRGQTIKEFEDQAYALKKGETSKPFLTPLGYHIIKVADKGNFFPYDSVRADIRRFMKPRTARAHHIGAHRLYSQALEAGTHTRTGGRTPYRGTGREITGDERTDTRVSRRTPAVRNIKPHSVGTRRQRHQGTTSLLQEEPQEICVG